VRRNACLLFCIGACLLCGCASTRPSRNVMASVYGVNYSEDYVPRFSILTASGEPTGIGGVQVQEFSKGGLSRDECCALVPGAGQTMIVEWRVGRREDSEREWGKFRKSIVVRGETSSDPKSMNYLVVRFFPGHEVEAELMWESMRPDGEPSPRLDQLFYGRRIMRQMGD